MQRQSTKALLLIIGVIVLFASIPRAKRLFWRHQQPPKLEVQKAADVAYFYSVNCSKCRQTKREIRRLEAARPDLNVMKVETSNPGGSLLFDRWQNKYDVPQDERGVVPAMFEETTQKAYTGVDDITNAVQKLIEAKPGGEDKGKEDKDAGKEDKDGDGGKETTLLPRGHTPLSG